MEFKEFRELQGVQDITLVGSPLLQQQDYCLELLELLATP